MTDTTQTTIVPAPQDPGFRLPAGVQAAIAEANRLQREQHGPQDEPAPAEVTEPVTAAPDDAPAAAADPAPEPKTDAPVDWEGRYRAMKGRHDRAQETISSLTHDNAELRRALALAQTQSPAAAPSASPEIQFEDLTQEDINDYGPDLLKVVEKVAGKAIARVAAAHEQKFASLEQKVQGVTQVTQLSARERFDQTLTQQVPNWREVNRDDNFLSWLEQPDLFSGQLKKELLIQAYNQGDAPRVAAIFKGFLQEASPATAPQAGTRTGPKVSLESLAAPGRARSTAPASGPADKPFITTAEIDRFYSDVQRGKYRGRDDEKNSREAEIFAAQAEGRIR